MVKHLRKPAASLLLAQVCKRFSHLWGRVTLTQQVQLQGRHTRGHHAELLVRQPPADFSSFMMFVEVCEEDAAGSEFLTSS